MNFEYDKSIITTQDEIKILVADLRDLINASQIKIDEQALNEYTVIVECILRKNNIQKNAITLKM